MLNPPLRLRRWLRRTALAAVLVAAAACVSSPLRRFWSAADLFLNQDRKSAITLALLRSESMSFLVTRRLCATVVLEKNDHSVLFGERRGLLIADVEQYYGFDFGKVTGGDIRRDGGRLTIRLPEPEFLGGAVDLSGMRTYTWQSGLSLIRDKWSGRDLESELRREFTGEAKRYFADRKLIPSRAEMIENLNRLAVPLLAGRGVPVRFE